MFDRIKQTAPFAIGFLAIWATLDGVGRLREDPLHGPLVLAAALGVALLVERYFYGVRPRQAIFDLGFGRPTPRSLLAATMVCLPIVGLYAGYLTFVDSGITLRDNWLLLVIGLFAFNGLAEEMAWRGFMYRRLRASRSFRGAVLASMPLMTLTHVPIMIENGPAVGIAALLVAAITCLPFAYLFDRGSNTIWAAAMLHATIDVFRLLDIPEADRAQFSIIISLGAAVVPLLVFLLRERFFATRPRESGAATTRGEMGLATR
jgi:membrane protease YdiL (CAAX protease family)